MGEPARAMVVAAYLLAASCQPDAGAKAPTDPPARAPSSGSVRVVAVHVEPPEREAESRGGAGSGPSEPSGAADRSREDRGSPVRLLGPQEDDRSRTELIADLRRLDAAARALSPASSTYAELAHERARTLSALGDVADSEGDAKLAGDARRRAIEQYEQLRASAPHYGRRDELLYELGSELLAGGNATEGRRALLELVSDHPSSPLLPHAYLLFADRFLEEAGSDPSKLTLAKKAYERVLTFPPPGNRVYGYAAYKLAWIAINEGHDQDALASFLRVLELDARQSRSSSQDERLFEQTRRDLVATYARVGRPDRAAAFFRSACASCPKGDAQAMAMLRQLATTYADQGATTELGAVCGELARRGERSPSCGAVP